MEVKLKFSGLVVQSLCTFCKKYKIIATHISKFQSNALITETGLNKTCILIHFAVHWGKDAYTLTICKYLFMVMNKKGHFPVDQWATSGRLSRPWSHIRSHIIYTVLISVFSFLSHMYTSRCLGLVIQSRCSTTKPHLQDQHRKDTSISDKDKPVG